MAKSKEEYNVEDILESKWMGFSFSGERGTQRDRKYIGTLVGQVEFDNDNEDFRWILYREKNDVTNKYDYTLLSNVTDSTSLKLYIASAQSSTQYWDSTESEWKSDEPPIIDYNTLQIYGDATIGSANRLGYTSNTWTSNTMISGTYPLVTTSTESEGAIDFGTAQVCVWHSFELLSTTDQPLYSEWIIENAIITESKKGAVTYLKTGVLPDDLIVKTPEGDDAELSENPDGDDTEAIGHVPDGSPCIDYAALAGASNYYAMSDSKVELFFNWLWNAMLENVSDVILNAATSIYNNLGECVESLRLYPLEVSNPASTETIMLGRFNSGLATHPITSQKVFVHSTFTFTPEVPGYKGEFFAFEPYSTYEIYLPFVGFKPFSATDLAGIPIQVSYAIDFRTGQGTCRLKKYLSDNDYCLLDEFDCNIGVDVPFSTSSGIGIMGNIVNAMTDAMPGAKELKSMVGIEPVSVEGIHPHSSSNSANHLYSPYQVYIICKYASVQYDDTYLHAYGRPSMMGSKLSKIKGYTECINVDIDFGLTKTKKSDGTEITVVPTSQECELIKQLLEEGVYL